MRLPLRRSSIPIRSQICKARVVLNLTADEDAMTKRILARAETSGRSDDNVEALRKRFATHREQCEWFPSRSADRCSYSANHKTPQANP
jgi:predicted kinase